MGSPDHDVNEFEYTLGARHSGTNCLYPLFNAE